MTISASAPAKIILFGEHAVVYGEPAIAVPVTALQATADISPSDDGFKIIAYDLDDAIIRYNTYAEDQPLQRVLTLLQDVHHCDLPSVSIGVRSHIPMASGLGSGAAVTTAIARAVTQAMGKTLSLDALNRIVYEVETIHHGTPSGIDNTVIVYEQPIYFVREQPIEHLMIGQPFTLIVADTGETALTHIAVGDVRKLVTSEPEQYRPMIREIGKLTKLARQHLEAGEIKALGPLMDTNHAWLQQLTVSSPKLDQLVTAARAAGALGAKLSGGGRGGNMIALVQPEAAGDVMAALTSNGAVSVLQTMVN
ncbi:mevalonate kinase [Phototrophicus methaneseepsis]|uniref:Mevalonate kinase n=1 Tax=Phototrophicus methaneseepsis TaxID=2710758 RepID=A0A7S8E6F1_9CHLR|nr:mevalonate kinase [Phototrophicus methaneseepsis]QPC81234.1 mevalonate kinase [Phototrophicus methaneseepsis]